MKTNKILPNGWRIILVWILLITISFLLYSFLISPVGSGFTIKFSYIPRFIEFSLKYLIIILSFTVGIRILNRLIEMITPRPLVVFYQNYPRLSRIVPVLGVAVYFFIQNIRLNQETNNGYVVMIALGLILMIGARDYGNPPEKKEA